MSRRIFYADFRFQSYFDNQSEFHRLGRELDIEFDWIANETITNNTLAHWEANIASADAVVLQGMNLPKPLEGSYRKILDRIHHGMSALVYCLPGRTDELSWFLSKFDISPTAARIDSTEVGTRLHSVVTFRRQSEEFADSPLLKGVDELTITQPRVLIPGPDATSLVSSRYGKEIVCEDDAARSPRRSAPCVVSWTGALGQLVVVVGGQLFHDSGIGCIGDHFPGIGRIGNKQFAVNLLDRLTGWRVEPTAEPNRLCEQIEIDLASFVMEVLKAKFGDGWWAEGVPDQVREKCLDRQKGEKLPLSDECYLNLIELRTIIEKNWSHFAKHFLDTGLPEQKSKATGWIETFNSDIRRMVAHPLKRHLSGHSFSDSDIDTLTKWSTLAKGLLASARRST